MIGGDGYIMDLKSATNLYKQLYNQYLNHEKTYINFLHQLLNLSDGIEVDIIQNYGIRLGNVPNNETDSIIDKLKVICTETYVYDLNNEETVHIIAYFKEEYTI